MKYSKSKSKSILCGFWPAPPPLVQELVLTDFPRRSTRDIKYVTFVTKEKLIEFFRMCDQKALNKSTLFQFSVNYNLVKDKTKTGSKKLQNKKVNQDFLIKETKHYITHWV